MLAWLRRFFRVPTEEERERKRAVQKFHGYFGFDPDPDDPGQQYACLEVYRQRCVELQEWYATSKKFFDKDSCLAAVFVGSVEYLEDMDKIFHFFFPTAEAWPIWRSA